MLDLTFKTGLKEADHLEVETVGVKEKYEAVYCGAMYGLLCAAMRCSDQQIFRRTKTITVPDEYVPLWHEAFDYVISHTTEKVISPQKSDVEPWVERIMGKYRHQSFFELTSKLIEQSDARLEITPSYYTDTITIPIVWHKDGWIVPWKTIDAVPISSSHDARIIEVLGKPHNALSKVRSTDITVRVWHK